MKDAFIDPAELAAWSTAVPDWEERIVNRQSLIPDLPLFDEPAEKALRIFKRLKVPDLMDQPTYGEVSAPWVFDFVRAVFGSYDPVKKRRMLREFFLLIPKKNGKSAIAAAIILTACIMNERPEAELLLIAPTMTIAKISFKQIKGIIRADPELDKRFHIQDHARTITHKVSRAEISVKAADGDVITGGKATYTMIDETHEFAKKSKADGVFLELRGALASRPEGFVMQITTQSKDQPAGVFKAELETARAVRDGRLQSPMLAVLYELPHKMAKKWQKPETWGLVNPHLGRSVDPAFLEDQLVKAREKGPKALQLLASQHFNVEIGVGLGGGWSGALYWKKAGPETFGLEELISRCEVAVLGLDGGGLDDLFGLSVVGRERETKNWLMWFHAWAHPEVLRARKEIAPRLHDFAKAGDLTLLKEDQPTGDIEGATQIAGELLNAGLLPAEAAVGLDTVQVYSILEEMMAIGIDEDQLRYVGQDWRLSPAIWGMERKLKDGTLLHSNQPMMEWVLGNAKVEQRGSAVRMTKEAAGRAKIDPLIAGMNAFTLMSRNPVAAGAQAFEYTGM